MGKTSFIEMSTGKTNYRDELLDKTRCTSEIGSQIILHQVSDASKATQNANFGAARCDIIRHTQSSHAPYIQIFDTLEGNPPSSSV